MTRPPSLALLGLCAALAGGCATTHGQVAAPPVTLDTPLPPHRVVIPQLLDPEEPPAPVAPPPAPPETPSSIRPRPQANNSKPTEKPDPPPASQPAPEPPAAPQPAPGGEPLETTTRKLLRAAEHDLDALSDKELSADARAHYQRARSFIAQAFAALRNKNYPFAEKLANNAATLAKELRKLLFFSATTSS